MTKILKPRLLILVGLIALLWTIELADNLSHHLLDNQGALQPRTQIGLAQIFSAPFLHANWPHLIGNTIALIPLGILMLIQRAFIPVMLISIVVGGLGTWACSTGPSLGFSGVLFGFMGFLLARGIYTRKPMAIVISLLTFTYFSGVMLQGLIPQAQISWAGHFWGFVAGVLAAKKLPSPRAGDV